MMMYEESLNSRIDDGTGFDVGSAVVRRGERRKLVWTSASQKTKTQRR